MKRTGLALLILAISSLHAGAQWPPEKTVRIIVPFSAGSVAGVMVRVLAQEVSDNTGRKILVEIRPGGGAVIATRAVGDDLSQPCLSESCTDVSATFSTTAFDDGSLRRFGIST